MGLDLLPYRSLQFGAIGAKLHQAEKYIQYRHPISPTRVNLLLIRYTVTMSYSTVEIVRRNLVMKK